MSQDFTSPVMPQLSGPPSSLVIPVPITGVGVVSAAGLGVAALAAALNGSAISDSPPPEPGAGDYPPTCLRPVPELDFAAYLGRKGLRHLDRTTKLGLLACRQALQQNGAAPEISAGVVMGTSTGSIRSSAEFCRDTFVYDRPYLVNASSFPNTVMNCCAGQIAIRNSLRGVNATLAGGQLSSLFALRYARNALRRDHAPRLLVGGVEELSPQSAWAWHHANVLDSDAILGEGCAVFTCSGEKSAPGEASPLAYLLACEVAYLGTTTYRGRRAEGFGEVIRRALQRSGVQPAEVDTVSFGAVGHPGLRRIEERAVNAELGEWQGKRIRVADILGECFSAAGAMQLAALLALWRDPAPRSGIGLVTCVGLDGNVGCLVVKRESASRQQDG